MFQRGARAHGALLQQPRWAQGLGGEAAPEGAWRATLGSSVSSKRSLQLLRDLGPLLCLSVPWFPHLQSRRGDVTAPAAACENSGNYCCKALRTVPDASEHPRPSGISMALIPSPPLFFQGTDGSAAWSKSNVVYPRGHAAR